MQENHGDIQSDLFLKSQTCAVESKLLVKVLMKGRTVMSACAGDPWLVSLTVIAESQLKMISCSAVEHTTDIDRACYLIFAIGYGLLKKDLFCGRSFFNSP